MKQNTIKSNNLRHKMQYTTVQNNTIYSTVTNVMANFYIYIYVSFLLYIFYFLSYVFFYFIRCVGGVCNFY